MANPIAVQTSFDWTLRLRALLKICLVHTGDARPGKSLLFGQEAGRLSCDFAVPTTSRPRYFSVKEAIESVTDIFLSMAQ